jgi:hypothetical protein
MEGQCLHIASRRSDDRLLISSERADGILRIVSAIVGQDMHATSDRVDMPLVLAGSRKDQQLSIRSSVVCEVSTGNYLYVMPEVIWLLPDSADVEVRSNVDWRIE